MGNCCGLLNEAGSTYDEAAQTFERHTAAAQQSQLPAQRRDTPADADARARAAEAASARQAAFESSAVGKAATKAVREVKQKPVQNDLATAQASSNARDWLS